MYIFREMLALAAILDIDHLHECCIAVSLNIIQCMRQWFGTEAYNVRYWQFRAFIIRWMEDVKHKLINYSYCRLSCPHRALQSMNDYTSMTWIQIPGCAGQFISGLLVLCSYFDVNLYVSSNAFVAFKKWRFNVICWHQARHFAVITYVISFHTSPLSGMRLVWDR